MNHVQRMKSDMRLAPRPVTEINEKMTRFLPSRIALCVVVAAIVLAPLEIQSRIRDLSVNFFLVQRPCFSRDRRPAKEANFDSELSRLEICASNRSATGAVIDFPQWTSRTLPQESGPAQPCQRRRGYRCGCCSSAPRLAGCSSASC